VWDKELVEIEVNLGRLRFVQLGYISAPIREQNQAALLS
jgi:hypothetical protein